MRPAVERFWEKVSIQAPNQCWPYTGYRTQGGYGGFRVSTSRRTTAHRFAYELAFEPVPEGIQVMHICHNLLCCNPKHLVVGSPQENCLHDSISGKIQTNSPFEIVGVHWRENRQVWVAIGIVDGVNTQLYYGPSKDDAIAARKQWEADITRDRLSFLHTTSLGELV
jgi:hypothetical protein